MDRLIEYQNHILISVYNYFGGHENSKFPRFRFMDCQKQDKMAGFFRCWDGLRVLLCAKAVGG